MNALIFNDVTLRDGLQSLGKFIQTEHKITLANKIIDCGIRFLEITSFVHPVAVPQMRDAYELATDTNLKDAYFGALVPNVRGYKRAVGTKIKEIVLFVSSCPFHNIKNLGQPIEDTLKEFEKIFQLNENKLFNIKPAISMVFGSPFTKKLPEGKNLFSIIDFFLEKGIHEITLCDTWGYSEKEYFERQLKRIKKHFSDTFFSLHLHNVKNRGIENLKIALDNGITKIDTVFGVTGGCPFSPEAGVNLNIRDAIKIAENTGFQVTITESKLDNVENFLNILLSR